MTTRMMKRRVTQSTHRPTPWLWIIAGVATFVLATPGEALAWGPVFHVGIGTTLLGELSLLPAAVAAVLSRRRVAYLYGCVAADIVFAKRLSRVKQCCHHWSTAFALLDDAEDDADTAFAYGYLSHLAADTVAHNRFVPHQVTISGMAVGIGHFYWELRADGVESPARCALLESVLGQDHARHHQSLAVHIRNTLLTYDMNRALFARLNAVAVHRGFRRTVNVWNRCARRCLSPSLMEGYRAESMDRTISVLSEGKRSPLLREDPNGTSTLSRLQETRRHNRRLRRWGFPIEQRVKEAACALAPKEYANSLGSAA